MTTAPTTRSPRPDATAMVDPTPIMQLASGFMGAKHLFAASELGLFEALAQSPATLQALAARTGLTTRAARISADAMVALGILEREEDRYRNSPAAAAYLSQTSPADLRPFLRFWDKVSYGTWAGLADALASGPQTQVFDLDDETQAVVSAGIEAVLIGPAQALAHGYDFGAHRRLLDIGGGTGSWSLAIARRHPTLAGTVLDLPVVVELARQRIADAAAGERVTATACDVTVEELPPGYDVFLVANLIHYWNPTDICLMLEKVRRAAEPGARLLIADFWTNSTHTEPVHAALMAGEFAVHLRDGDVYSVDEARSWLPRTGWRFVDHAPLAGPQSLVVAEAV